MRVLQWSHLYAPDVGGIETLVRSLVPELRSRGHELIVIASAGPRGQPGAEWIDGTAVHRFDFWGALEGRHLGRVAQLRREVRQVWDGFAPELVHLHFSATGAFFCHATSAGRPQPTLVSLHGDMRGQSAQPDTLLGRVLAAAAHVTAPSVATRDSALAVAPGIAERLTLVPNAVAAPPRGAVPPSGPPHVLLIGRLVRQKGFDVALRALATLRPRHPELVTTIAGSGPEEPALRELAGALGLDVRFAGLAEGDGREDLFARATLVCVPSATAEAAPLVPLEAAIRGRAVVASRVAGLAEQIVDGITGRLVPAGDVAALADAIDAILARPGCAADWGRAARERARRLYSVEAMVASYDGLYRQMASGGHA